MSRAFTNLCICIGSPGPQVPDSGVAPTIWALEIGMERHTAIMSVPSTVNSLLFNLFLNSLKSRNTYT